MGDVEGRASLLEKAGQHELANLTHQVHHLGQEDFEEKKIRDHGEGHSASQTAQLLLPPPPLLAADCPWPSPGLKSGEIVKEGYRDLAVGSS